MIPVEVPDVGTTTVWGAICMVVAGMVIGIDVPGCIMVLIGVVDIVLAGIVTAGEGVIPGVDITEVVVPGVMTV